MTEFEKKGAHFEKARVLAVDDDFAIGQIGLVDIFLFDLKSGDVVKYIDTDIIIASLEEHIHGLLGDHYYVPHNEENLRSKFVGILPYEFRGLLYLKEKRKFVINMVTVMFNRMNDLDQQLFLSLVAFDKNLENIEIIPFDPLNKSTNSGWINGGFFLGEDRMFTKMMAWRHDHDFDFLEYRLTDDHIYTLADTLFGVKTDTLGYGGRFHGCFAFNDKNYLNLGSMLYTFEGGKIKEGHLLPFPQKVQRNFLYIEPLDENHLVAYAINNYRNDPEPTGWLFLIDKDFAITRVIDKFDLREAVFCSLFTTGKSVYVANYDERNESYFLLRYE
ncbi:MAG TPA: hypothetical protein VI603_03185 [Saprospiraceae bacterium]|nr:hypothetical protein [Saprospiraceae bacterium]